MSILILGYLFIVGLLAGSFINALVWRLGQKLDSAGDPKKLTPKQAKKLSITKGRSICPNCQQRLAPKDLVPVFSWLALRGKCRYCHKPISKQYPIVELLTAVLFVSSYQFWPYQIDGAEWLVFVGFLISLVCLIALSVYDYWHKILPSHLIYIATAVYVSALLLNGIVTGSLDRFGFAFLAGVVYLALFFGIFMMSEYANKKGYSKKDWIGFGDVRLSFLLGLIAGDVLLAFFGMFSASLIGLIFIAPSLASKKLSINAQIPFGPFLIIGAIVAFWWGGLAMDWYANIVFDL